MGDKKSTAQDTIEFAIEDALAGTAHKTLLTPETAKIVVDTVMRGIFDKPIRWAVGDYLMELGEEIEWVEDDLERDTFGAMDDLPLNGGYDGDPDQS
jgi:hypothetical protein